MRRRWVPVVGMFVVSSLACGAFLIALRPEPPAPSPNAHGLAQSDEETILREFGGPRMFSRIPSISLEALGATQPEFSIPSRAGRPMLIGFVSAQCAGSPGSPLVVEDA